MKRLMRLRSHKLLRDLCSETDFTTAHLIQPLFVVDGIEKDEPIAGLKGTFRQTKQTVLAQIEKDLENGVRHFILFPVPREKKQTAFDHSFSADVISAIRKRFGDQLFLWVDTCLCSYTTHGHCCVLNDKNELDHEATLSELSRSALAFARAGANGISPSDMMDGRVGAIREALDQHGFPLVPIMSYSTKFASNFYGPFRNAADSSPQFGDRKTYQIDPRNRSDAMAASRRCAEEGADLLMVKPGMPALDLIAPIHKETGLSVGAYQVSGEYAGMVLLSENGLINFDGALLESWHCFRRAGAQYVITYGARFAKQLGVKTP